MPVGAHRYWRVLINANNGDPNLSVVGELEFWNNSHLSDLTGTNPGTPFDVGGYGSPYGPGEAFDDSATPQGDYWSSAVDTHTGCAVGFAFDTAQEVTYIRLYAARDEDRVPKDFDIQWSDDGITYTTAWSVVGATGWTLGEWRTFTGPDYIAPTDVRASKLVGYAVLNYPEGRTAASKTVGYAVLDIEHAQVYASKLAGYAVVSPAPADPIVGQTLGRQGGTWENDPTSFIDQWQRDGVDISGATSPTYVLVPADAGTMIRNKLIAVNANGQSDPVYSEPLGPIQNA